MFIIHLLQSQQAPATNLIGGGSAWASEWNTQPRKVAPRIDEDESDVPLANVDEIIKKQETRGSPPVYDLSSVIPVVLSTVKRAETQSQSVSTVVPLFFTVDDAIEAAVQAAEEVLDRRVEALINTRISFDADAMSRQFVAQALEMLKQHRQSHNQAQRIARIVAALK